MLNAAPRTRPGHSASAGAPVTWAAVEPDRQADIAALDSTLTTVERVLDVEGLRSRIEKLEHEAADPNLWDDQARAQRVTSELSHTQGELRRVEDLRRRLDDLPVLYEMAAEEDGAAAAEAQDEADAELKALSADIEAMEVRTLLSGEYDEREALVTIRSGAGGVDAADWAEMLMRMYIRWAEQHKYGVEVFDTSYAEEAGIKSATFAVHAPFAYGTLSVEQGTHRLVRISPFDNQSRRQTSFAEVEVLPVVETTDHIDIPEGDIRVDVYRSSGPGGQSVNTTDSAVRLTHIPTGIVVTCQNEKSQLQNKVAAMRVLQAKLLERKRLEERAELDALKGDGGSSWGNQMRSYVLHPYQMVKDLRTAYEVGNPAAVLDGDDEGFVESDALVRSEANKHRQTVASLISWVSVVLIAIVVAVHLADILNVSVRGFVAPATVVGAALGFGAQQMVRDLLAGFFIILEKQYGFGDLVTLTVVSATDATGTVENVTLRVTRLRSSDGELLTIPNGQIVKTVNLSKDWARAVVDIPVQASADLGMINDTLRQACEHALDDKLLGELLLDAPTVMGVERIEVDVVTL